MPSSWLILVFALSSFASVAQAAIVEHTFNMKISNRCNQDGAKSVYSRFSNVCMKTPYFVCQVIDVATLSLPCVCQPGNISVIVVNGRVPGPEIEAYEGDTVVVHVINNSPHDVTVHWHGIFQRGTPWADGPAMVTQCPIRPGHGYTYRFVVAGQEGTLWWHAHSSFMRATVHGALVVRPGRGAGAYPFPTPDEEKTVLLGEWWNGDTVLMGKQAFLAGRPMANADAYTINGMPGDLYACQATTTNRIAKFEVRRNSTYLLRIINAALNTPFFYKVEGHTFTVVAADASYTTPHDTDVIVIAPGQTVDALMVADASPGCYYMAISSYQSALPLRPGFNANITTANVEYVDAAPRGPQAPAPPAMPEPTDTPTAHRFYTSLTTLVHPGRPTVPLAVDTRMFVTIGLGFSSCEPEQTLCNRSASVVVASMNNESFALPTGTVSMLEARYRNRPGGVYTRDFPDQPPLVFDYTNEALSNGSPALSFTTSQSTKVKTLKYNATVEMVLQNTALVGRESHPMHLHGFNFFVLAQGFGNYDGAAAVEQFNLVNPQVRNTVAVPTGGWAVIRFVANNPGMWIMHCHIDAHLSIGLAMVFEVESGPTPETALPPPPQDLPQCY